MAIEKYDLLVIGTGRAGKDVAIACADAGWKVAIADNREYGGTCANRGCDPKKVIVGLTEILHRSSLMQNNGLTSMPKYSWADLQKFKAKFTDAVPYVNERRLKGKNITLYHQSPRFISKNTLSVEGKTIHAKKIVIATGLKPASFLYEGAALAKVSDDFLNLESLPKSIIFIGGGYIGMELAHIAARVGVNVTIVHAHERPLNGFDKDLVDKLVDSSKELGIKFYFNAKANKIEKLEKYYKVTTIKEDETIELEAKEVFNCAGRVPSIDELDLENGKVAFSKKGITVNSKLQSTTNEDVYACGDVAASSGLPLTPIAPIEAEIVISQLLDSENKKEATYNVQPSVVFTIPSIASVGMTMEEAEKLGSKVYIKYEEDASSWFSAKHINNPTYSFKTIVEKSSGKILGAHIIGEDVGELINMFSLIISNNLTIEDIKQTIFAYPTKGSEIKLML